MRNIQLTNNSNEEIDYDTSIELQNLTDYFDDIGSHKSGFSAGEKVNNESLEKHSKN